MLIVTIMLSVIFAMVFHFTGRNMEMESIRMMQMHDRGPRIGPRGLYLSVQLSADGQIVEQDGEDYDLSEEEISQIVTLAVEGEEPIGLLEDYDLRYFRAPGREGQRIVFADTSVETNMMNNLIKDGILIALASLVVFFVISLLLSRWAIKPVERAWTQQRQFVADASHELKTPLTVILTNAELMQLSEYEIAEKQVFAENILTMSKQMRGLVEDLLDLARLDHDANKTQDFEINLSELAASVVLSFEVLFYEKGLSLKTEIEQDVCVSGNEKQLYQLMEILLDNALKYSLPGTTVRSLRRQGSKAELSVCNPGEQIGEEDLQNIFKRFYRVDEARSLNGSYGLGLSIAEQITEKHKGKISAESKNGMNTFTAVIPLSK